MILQKIKDFLKEEEGLAAVEYSVLAAVVVAGVLALAPIIYKGSGGGNGTGGILDVAIDKLETARSKVAGLVIPN